MTFARNNVPFLIAAILGGAGCASGEDTTTGFVATDGMSSGGGGSVGSQGNSTDGSGTQGSDGTTTGAASTSTGGPTGTTGETGQPVCSVPWRVDTAMSVLVGLSQGDDGTLYALGATDQSVGQVLALDPCDGTIVEGVQLNQGMNATTWRTAAASGDSVYIAGTMVPAAGQSQAVFGRLMAPGLTADWTVPIAASMDVQDTVRQIVQLSTGRLWMAGQFGAGLNQRPWWVSGSTLGQACGFTWGATPGDARVLIEGTEVIYSVVNLGTEFRVLQFDPTCTCQCAPTFVSPGVSIGAASTEAHDAVLLDGTLFVAGQALDDGMSNDHRTFIAALDASTGAVTATVTDNPSALIDRHQTLVTDGQQLLLGGTSAWAGTGSFAGAQAHLWSYDLPLVNGNAPQWDTDLANLDAVVGMVRNTSSGNVYTVGFNDGLGAVVACDSAGNC